MQYRRQYAVNSLDPYTDNVALAIHHQNAINVEAQKHDRQPNEHLSS